VVSAPVPSLPSGIIAGRAVVPVRLTWRATDNAAGTVASQLQLARIPGAFRTIRVPARRRVAIVWLAPGHTYVARVRATDAAGNRSAWSARRSFTLRRGGLPHTGGITIRARSLALIASTGPAAGFVRVRIGAFRAGVSLRVTPTATWRLALARTYSATASRFVRVDAVRAPVRHAGIAWLT
jgi:hypothetical protein